MSLLDWVNDNISLKPEETSPSRRFSEAVVLLHGRAW